ncbi:hypothetical protein FB451DRAFT_1174379 [Mycena latifolia]|nr:hypothetical protein FB451DRAFT_1174379 [Mycena latifolia]
MCPLCGNEATIESMPILGHSAKKTIWQGIQWLESKKPGFCINWDAIGLCLAQMAQNVAIWILDMNKIRASAGIQSDAIVIWEDLRTDMRNMADICLMARLYNVKNHQNERFGHLVFNIAASEILDVTIEKTFQKTVDWEKELSAAQNYTPEFI